MYSSKKRIYFKLQTSTFFYWKCVEHLSKCSERFSSKHKTQYVYHYFMIIFNNRREQILIGIIFFCIWLQNKKRSVYERFVQVIISLKCLPELRDLQQGRLASSQTPRQWRGCWTGEG